jgi:hypothetical protein
MYLPSWGLGLDDGRDDIYSKHCYVTSHVIYKTIYHMRESEIGDATSTEKKIY